MNRNRILPLMLVMVLLLVPLAASEGSCGSGHSVGGVDYSYFDDEQKITVSEKCKASLGIHNTNAEDVLVVISQPDDSPIELVSGAGKYPLQEEEVQVLTLEFKPQKTVLLKTYDVAVDITACDTEGREETATVTFKVTITSLNSNEQYYNKILGMFENPLPSPFNTVEWTVAITLCLWALISVIAVILAQGFIRLIVRKDELDEKAWKRVDRHLRIPIFVCIMLYGIVNCLRVYGMSESFVTSVNFITKIIYIPLIAYIAWKVYDAIVWRVLNDLEKKTGDIYIYESVSPLLETIGKILIVVISIAAILATLGLNLAVIITGAGIAGLAVSLGAKSAFNEFFSGITVMMTRPFKTGDIIKVEGTEDEMKVVNVGILRTEFVNRYNVDHFVVPNSTIASSKVTNYTRTTVKYRLFIYIRMFVDEDIDLAKKILYDVAYNEPDAITDGSVSKPHVRVNELKGGVVTLRLSLYIDEYIKKDYIYGKIREAILENYRKNGISPPINRIGITMMEEEE